RFVGAPVEGRYREPLLETGERLFALDARRKMLEQCRAAAAKAPALRREPTREGRAALDLEPLEEVAFEKRAERAKLLRCERREACLDRGGDLHRVDEGAAALEPDRVLAALEARRLSVDDLAQLAQAPAQLPARVVGRVPQELAEMRSREGTRGEREVGEQRAHLARGGQRGRRTAAACAQRAEEPDVQFRGVHVER